MAYPLTVFSPETILENWISHTEQIAKCDVCAKPIGTDTYAICRFPDPDASGSREAAVHKGHFACADCATNGDFVYIGDGGSCIVCFYNLGGRRSAISKAGVALRPAVKTPLLDSCLVGAQEAKQQVVDARAAADARAVQERDGARRSAVEAMARQKEHRRLELQQADAEERARTQTQRRSEFEDEEARQEEEYRARLQEMQEDACDPDYVTGRSRGARRKTKRTLPGDSATSEARQRANAKRSETCAQKARKLSHYDTLVQKVSDMHTRNNALRDAVLAAVAEYDASGRLSMQVTQAFDEFGMVPVEPLD